MAAKIQFILYLWDKPLFVNENFDPFFSLFFSVEMLSKELRTNWQCF